MLTSHKPIAIAVIVFVSILRITPATDAATDIAVPNPSLASSVHYILATLPPTVDQIASSLVIGQILGKLVLNDANLAHKLGFSSIADIASATIGQPLPIYIVKLDDLKSVMLNQSAYLDLLKSQGNLVGPLPGIPVHLPTRLLYPILVDGKTKSCMEVAFLPQKSMWKINTFGMPEFCRRIEQYKNNKTQFVMRIPAMNRDYLAASDPTSGEVFEFTALFNDTIPIAPGSPVTLNPGDTILGSLFFSNLKNEANKINPQVAR